MGRGGWAGVRAEPLMDDSLFPVCTPEIGAKLTSIDALSKAKLLHDDDPQAQWGRWLAEAGVPSSSDMAGAFGRGPRFASSALLLKASAAGHGVALARERLAGAWLENGILVRPFSEAIALGPAYWLVTRHGVEPRRPLRIFVAWLKRQAVPNSA
jgi:LysR family glycine cleavage system transcriptional activator